MNIYQQFLVEKSEKKSVTDVSKGKGKERIFHS